MKKINVLSRAVLCIAVGLLSCAKEAPELTSVNSDGQSANFVSVTDLKPDYVYTLAGNPDKFTQEDGVGDQATFINLAQLVADDGYLYAVDSYVIRKISLSNRRVTTLAGSKSGGFHRDGMGIDATLESPSSLALGPDGNIYVAELGQVSKITKERSRPLQVLHEDIRMGQLKPLSLFVSRRLPFVKMGQSLLSITNFMKLVKSTSGKFQLQA